MSGSVEGPNRQLAMQKVSVCVMACNDERTVTWSRSGIGASLFCQPLKLDGSSQVE